MNDHDLLDPLDARAARAARDLRARADARPRPAFDPDGPVLLSAPRSVAPRLDRRRWLAVAAVLLAVAGLAGGLALRAKDGGNDTAGVTSGDPRPFVATDPPAGLRLLGAYESDPAGTTPDTDPASFTAPALAVDLFGAREDDPRLAAGSAPGLSAELDGTPAEPTVSLGGGRTRQRIDTFGTALLAYLVKEGSMEVVLIGHPADAAVLDRVAGTVAVRDGRVVVDPSSLPDGWRRTGVEADLVGAISPVAATRRSGSPVRASVYAGGTSGGVDRYASVSSEVGDEARLAAVRLFGVDVREVSVRGHQALLARTGVGTGSQTVRVVAWLEEPGELLRVSAAGMSEAQVLRLAESVSPASDADWSDLLRRTRRGELAAPDGGPATEPVASGTFADGADWVLRAYPVPTTGDEAPIPAELVLSVDDGSVSGGASTTSGSSSGSGSGGADSGFLGLTTQQRGDRHVLFGSLGADVARVELRRKDGSVLSVAEVVSGQGTRAWVAELPVPDAEVVALDADGREIDRVTVGEYGDSTSFGGQGTPIETVETPTTTGG